MIALLHLAAVDVAGLTWRAGALVVSLLQPLFWALLAVGFVFAAIHFVSMLATRWGDRRASGKSLAFSAAVHVSLLVGILALLPDYRPRWLTAAEETVDEEPIQVRPIEVTEDLNPQSSTEGNTAIWDELQPTPEIEAARMSKTVETADEPTMVERSDRAVTAPFELPQDNSLPDLAQEVPQAMAAEETGSQTPAAVPMNIDDATAPESRAAPAPSMARDRSLPLSQAAQDMSRDLPTVDRVVRGAIDRRRDRYNPDAMIRSLPAAPSESATIARADSATISRREGPVPSTLPMSDAGNGEKTATARDGGGSASMVERQRTAAPQSDSTDRVIPLPERTPARSRVPGPQRTRSALDGFDIDQPAVREAPAFARVDPSVMKPSDKTRLPAEYQLRTSDGRLDAARRFGGNEQSERAVERSLKYLAQTQEPNGYWSAVKYGAGRGAEARTNTSRPNVGGDADAGVTALSVLAYLGAGSTHQRGPYQSNVDKALRWLIANQRDDGYLGGSNVSAITGAYSHAMATFAIAEASAMRESDDPRLRKFGDSDADADTRWLLEPLKKAIGYSVSAQLNDGGWRYEPNQPDGDTSIFGWHLMSLKSAELAGLEIPDEVRAGMVSFLKERALGESDGLAGYRLNDPVTPAMTAESLFCKQMLGLKRTSTASDEAVKYLLSHPPKLAEENFYYWYYGTLSMFQYGGEPWQTWNERVRDILVAEQKPDGSWAPRGPWGAYGGQIYSTALATLSLEVYYRYLPLYRAGGQYRESE